MLTREALFRLYWRMERALGVRYAPHPYEDALGGAVTASTRWLDIGCGHKVLDSWRGKEEAAMVRRARSVTGVDPYLPALRHHRSIGCRVCGGVSRLPFSDGEFNLVTASMVVEHLGDPQAQFAEVARVLEPGGRFIFLTPNARGYTVRMLKLLPEAHKATLAGWLEGRDQADVFPTHYRANTAEAISGLAAGAALEVVELRYTLNSAAFTMVPPLAALELCWLRLLMRPTYARLRPRLVAILAKSV